MTVMHVFWVLERITRREFLGIFEMGRSPLSSSMQEASDNRPTNTPIEGSKPTERELVLHAELIRLRAQSDELVSFRSSSEVEAQNIIMVAL